MNSDSDDDEVKMEGEKEKEKIEVPQSPQEELKDHYFVQTINESIQKLVDTLTIDPEETIEFISEQRHILGKHRQSVLDLLDTLLSLNTPNI